jgi:hypothetical protein
MEIHRSFGVARLVALMAEHRGRSAHERLLARLDRSVDEARELCERAEQLYPGDLDGAIEGAFGPCSPGRYRIGCSAPRWWCERCGQAAIPSAARGPGSCVFSLIMPTSP